MDFFSQTDSTANLEDLLQIATTSLKEGNKPGARVLIQQVLDTDKHNDRAWVLMAAATDDPVDRQRYLKTALRLNPNNKAAKKALDKMKKARNSAENQALYYGTIGLAIVLVIAVLACIAVLVIS